MTQENEVTPSTTNTAARELPDDIRVPLDSLHADIGYLIGRVAQDGSFAPAFAAVVRQRIDAAKDAIHATLTQQQGGEQEARKTEVMLRWLLARTYSGTNLYCDDGEMSDSSAHPAIDFLRDEWETIESKMQERTAALRSKPAASEGDWLPSSEELRLRMGELSAEQVRIAKSAYRMGAKSVYDVIGDPRVGVSFRIEAPTGQPPLIPLYKTPPRHPADEGVAMQWPRGVLNRDKTLELLISHNEWRRGKEGPQTDPRLLGLALEATIAALQAGTP